MSPITDKIIAALANSSSTNYVDERALHSLGKKSDISNVLKQLIEQRTIINCRITKNSRTFEVYWLALQLSKPKSYSDVFTPEKRLERAAAKRVRPLKNTTERHCNLCDKTQPNALFNGRRNQCKKCVKARTDAKKKSSAELKPRWCMACKKNHPSVDFKSALSRRCIAATLSYQQNKTAILVQKNREWRARVKAAQVKNPPALNSV